MAKVHLAASVPMPAEVVTEAMAIMGRRGAGKSYAAGRLFEEMFGLGAQCLVLDPVGSWWGLRLSSSGKGPGLDVPVFGGDHGDIPLEVEAGALIARVVTERRLSAVIDVSGFRKYQMKQFATAFAEELYQLQKKERAPLHLFIEEARTFIPQRMFGDQDPRLVGAFEDIVRRGRNYGIGCTLIDQRPQSVNKEVLSQAEVLIAMQMTDKLGRKEIEDWVRQKEVAGAEKLAQLATLQPGEAFVWSPGFLKTFTKVKVGKKKTYDSSATPKLGSRKAVEPRPLSKQDLAELRESMKEVVERLEAGSPKRLASLLSQQREVIRQQKADLDALAAKAEAEKAKPALRSHDVSKLERLLTKVDKQRDSLTQALQALTVELGNLGSRLQAHNKPAGNGLDRSPPPARPQPVARPTKPARTDQQLTGPEQRILDALAWLEALGVEAPPNEAVAFLAGYRPGGGAYSNPRGKLRVAGLIDYVGKGQLVLTTAGRSLANAPDLPPTTKELQEAVLSRLNGPEQRILRPLLEAYPQALELPELAAKAGYDHKGGAFSNPRGRLRTLGLVTYPKPGTVRASDILWPT
jgi:uncharacterized protein